MGHKRSTGALWITYAINQVNVVLFSIISKVVFFFSYSHIQIDGKKGKRTANSAEISYSSPFFYIEVFSLPLSFYTNLLGFYMFVYAYKVLYEQHITIRHTKAPTVLHQHGIEESEAYWNHAVLFGFTFWCDAVETSLNTKLLLHIFKLLVDNITSREWTKWIKALFLYT